MDTKTTFTDKQMEIAVAWANNEITMTEVCKKLKIKKTHQVAVYSFLARCLRQYFLTLPLEIHVERKVRNFLRKNKAITRSEVV